MMTDTTASQFLPGYPVLDATQKQLIVRHAQTRLAEALSQASAPVGIRRGPSPDHPVRVAYNDLRNPKPGDFVFDQRYVQLLRDLTPAELEEYNASSSTWPGWLHGMVVRYLRRDTALGKQPGWSHPTAICELPDGTQMVWQTPQLVKIELDQAPASEFATMLHNANVPVADWCQQCGQIVRRARDADPSDAESWSHDRQPDDLHAARPGPVLKPEPFDGTDPQEPQLDAADVIEGSERGSEWLQVEGHQIQLGGSNGDGYCYQHQSFDCLDQLQQEAEAKRNRREA